MKKPCLIFQRNGTYDVANENGHLIFCGQSWYWAAQQAKAHDFEVVSPNSRIGRTIFDKLPLYVQMQIKHFEG